MTPFGKWIRNRAEKLLGRYEEGELPPTRLREQAADWGNRHSRATRREWFEFASEFADQAYRAGYIRGVEWAEREPPTGGPTPEELADALGPGWRERPWRPELAFEVAPDDVPPDHRTDEEAMREQLEDFRRGRT